MRYKKDSQKYKTQNPRIIFFSDGFDKAARFFVLHINTPSFNGLNSIWT
jgi:hypothetical protein